MRQPDADGEEQPASEDFHGVVQPVFEDAESLAWLVLVFQQRVLHVWQLQSINKQDQEM